jgi:hypothetical protein
MSFFCQLLGEKGPRHGVKSLFPIYDSLDSFVPDTMGGRQSNLGE